MSGINTTRERKTHRKKKKDRKKGRRQNYKEARPGNKWRGKEESTQGKTLVIFAYLYQGAQNH